VQHVKCKVFLAGDRNHQVHIPDATVAEAVVLEHIHGSGSVTDVKPTRMGKEEHSEERERLRRKYHPKAGEDRRSIVDSLFPGANAKLPISLKDIGVEAPKAGKAKAEAKAEPKQAETADSGSDDFLSES